MTETLTATALEIRRLFWMVTKLAQRDVVRRLEARGIALGGLPFGVLRMLRRRPCTSSELSREMMLAPATLVPAVDTLERAGFVKRGQDLTDRRRTPLTLTERGAALVAAVPMVSKEDSLVRGLGALSATERVQLRRVLRKLVHAMLPSSRSTQSSRSTRSSRLTRSFVLERVDRGDRENRVDHVHRVERASARR